MQLKRDKESEQYEAIKGVFEAKIPNGFYEIIIRGELTYPLLETENRWISTCYLKKCDLTDKFIEDILSIELDVYDQQRLNECYDKVNNLITDFINNYCYKYNKLPYDIPMFIVTEDRYNMEKYGTYYPITQPFKVFVTYNDNGIHYEVTK